MEKIVKSIVLCSLIMMINSLDTLDHHHHDDFEHLKYLKSSEDKIITREELENLKKIAPFQIYDYEDHPFKDYTLAQIKERLGLLGISSEDHQQPLPYKDPNISITEEFPKKFEVKDKWPKCQHDVRDQGQCGSCWAFGAASVLSDRFCISSKSKINVELSPQDMVSCDFADLGCQGGYLDRSWRYLIDTGIVDEKCFPYTSGSGQRGTCDIIRGICKDGKTKAKKYKAKSFKMFKSIQEIKKDIITDGSVETGFMVYQDFISYKGGVYKKKSDVFLGGHAVRIVGWGIDDSDGTEYWKVVNSWGKRWGEDGYFRFAIGNCCSFEQNMITGTPNLTMDDFLDLI
jgi:cathepsin B